MGWGRGVVPGPSGAVGHPGALGSLPGVPGVGQLIWVLTSIVVSTVPLGLSVWALLDIANRPAWAWALAGRSRQWWLFGVLVGIASVLGGLIISLVYLLRIRPEIAAAEDGRLL